MATHHFDVLGIGNAIVDVIARADEKFLTEHGMQKGAMALIDENRAQAIYAAMGSATEVSGGSAANTIVGAASLGARVAFVGKVKEDELGKHFAHDIRAAGVAFETKFAHGGPSTARCYIMVTPDGERTMNTFLGAAQNLTAEDIHPASIAGAAITYLEGYLWDPPHAKEAFRKAAAIAHGAQRKVALTLSDAFCVSRYRAEFLELIRTGTVDIVFANESELLSLYESKDFASAAAQLGKDAKLAVVTRSEKGCVVIEKQTVEAVPAHPIKDMVDATGAGDLFAAGFLVGHSRGQDNKTAARLGALAAAEVIQHIGARPQSPLRALAKQHGLAS
jgi:adenosine kinase